MTSNPRSFLAELLRDALDPRMSNDCLGIHVRGGLEKLRALIRQEQSNDSAPVRDRQRDSVPAVDSPNRLGILARSGYVTSGPHLSGYRLTLGFETLAEVSEAHQAIADLKIGAVETSVCRWLRSDRGDGHLSAFVEANCGVSFRIPTGVERDYKFCPACGKRTAWLGSSPEEPTEPYHGIGCAVRRGGSCNCAAEGKPEKASDNLPPSGWRCSCKPPGDVNSLFLSVCKDCGTVRPGENGAGEL